jgi:hypothetical protein
MLAMEELKKKRRGRPIKDTADDDTALGVEWLLL